MARQNDAGGSTAQAQLASLLATCRKGTPAPVYLFVGESIDTRAAAEAIIDALVPPERRAFNLEAYDGRTVPLPQVLGSLRTPAFFPGIKLVWVRESAIFLSGAKKGDLAKSMLTAWEGGRQREATEKLATLVALAGWSTERFVGTDWNAATKTALREVFGDDVGAEHGATLQAVQQALLARDVKLGEFRDESALLLEYLEGTPMPNAVLVFTTTAVDGRKRVVKVVQERGAVVEFAVERERSGALARDSVAAIAAQRCVAAGKKLQRAATELIVRRAGQDVASLANELEKLCLYVGERTTIEEADVRAVFLDMAESWIFDFTGGLAARDATKTLPVLRGLLSQGEAPLRVLAMVAREVRMLLVARECIDCNLQGTWRAGMSYPTFQSRVLQNIDDATKASFGKSHPFALYRRFDDASRIPAARLRRALLDVAALDLRFKSSGGDPALLLESFVIGWCR